MRYYIGVDWAEDEHAIWVEDEQGARVLNRAVPHTAVGLAEWGRWLEEQRAGGTEIWAAIGPPPRAHRCGAASTAGGRRTVGC